MASGPTAPKNNLAQLRDRYQKSGAANNASGGTQPVASGSKFAFRDPDASKSSVSSKKDQEQQQAPLKRNAASAGLGTRASPAKTAPVTRVKPISAPIPPPLNNSKGKQKAPAPSNDSALHEDLQLDGFWPTSDMLADIDEMEAEAQQFEQEEHLRAAPQLSPPGRPQRAPSRQNKPLSPKKNSSLFVSRPPPPSSSASTASSSRSQTGDLANTSTASDSATDKIQAELDTMKAKKEHYQNELLECVTTGTCESGMSIDFLEKLLKGVTQRVQSLQGQLENQQAALPEMSFTRPEPPAFTDTSNGRYQPPDVFTERSGSPLADLRPAGPSATKRPSLASSYRPDPPSRTKHVPLDQDEPLLADSESEKDDMTTAPAAANQSDEFDHMYADFDEADLDQLDIQKPAHAETEQQPTKSTPKKTMTNHANESKTLISIDSDTEDEEQPIVSKHFKKLSSAMETAASGRKTQSGPDPRLSQHTWSRDVFKALSQVFKLPGFRKNQLEAINGALGGQDVFVLMPTGGGKSLCYQLPAVVHSGKTRGITIVISPLISLIQDQINALVAKGISALPFNGDMDREQRDFVLGEMRSREPTVGLIYVTPEMLSSSGVFASALERLHGNRRLARFVVDEAHCISTWGHDYRPAYKELDKLKRNFSDIPIIALTATANSRVRQDVISNLGLKSPVVLTQSFNRTNLHYDVRKKDKGFMEQIATFIKREHAGECGIIYCLSKKNCEDVASQLRSKHGVKAMHYHAGMDKNDRKRVQLDWQSGKLLVICATIAFGMGIDKENCRFVVHHSLPKSLEGYYQETGRAGRDGNPSVCILYFAYSDSHSLNRLIDMGDGSQAQKERAKAEVRHVVQYCMNTTDCRRAQVLNYFGEQFDPQLCGGACDICAAGPQTQAVDVSDHAKAAVELVRNLTRRSGSKVTLVHCVDVFRGSRAKKILDQGHDEVEGYAAGASLERGDAERLFQQLVNCEVLGEVAEQTGSGFSASYLSTGKYANAVLAGKRPVSMHLSAPKGTIPLKPKWAAGAKTKVSGRRKSANQASWDSDDDDFIDTDEDSEPVKAPSRKANGADDSETRYAALQSKCQQIFKKQPALADMVTDEFLQELALMPPSSVDDMYDWDSLSSWARKDLHSNRKVFSDLLDCAKKCPVSVAAARSRAVRRISGYAYDNQEEISTARSSSKRKSSASAAPPRKTGSVNRGGPSGTGKIMAAPM